MSKLFFDNLIDLSEIDKKIKKVATSQIEREELWQLVDEIVHHKVMGCVLDNLPQDNHEEFLEMYHKNPHDEKSIFEYLKNKVGKNMKEIIRQEIGALSSDLLEEIKSS